MKCRKTLCFLMSLVGLCWLFYAPIQQVVYGESAGFSTETEVGFVKGGIPPTSSSSKKGLLPNTGEEIIAWIVSVGVMTLIVILVVYITKKNKERVSK